MCVFVCLCGGLDIFNEIRVCLDAFSFGVVLLTDGFINCFMFGCGTVFVEFYGDNRQDEIKSEFNFVCGELSLDKHV